MDMIEAVVQVGEQETPVLRCGSGARTVLLLAADDGERRRLALTLAVDARVIGMRGCWSETNEAAPSRACGGGAAGCACALRVAAVVEGLGVAVAYVVSTADTAAAAAAVAGLLDVEFSVAPAPMTSG